MYGKSMKNYRISQNITQMELSKGTGLPQATISWIENDKGIPNIEQVKIIAKYYNITIDELIEDNK